MSVHAQTVIQWFESFAPKQLALEGDKIGLQVGQLHDNVQCVLVTLDVTEDVVDEAIKHGASLIIAHHPFIFHALNTVRTDTPKGRILAKLLQNEIAVYVAHTNLDIADGGVNDWLAERLGLHEVDVLSPTFEESLFKLVAFVPKDAEQRVRQAIGDVGAGWIGNYSHCTFRTSGTGTFLPRDGATPYIGHQGKLEQVNEWRIETVVTESQRHKVIQALTNAHPYEEPAYDLYPLHLPGKKYGLGRIGRISESCTLQEFAEYVKVQLDVPAVRAVGDLNKPVRKVAVLGGDGNKYVQRAVMQGADVYITGDMYFHTAQDAAMTGMAILDPGHHVEKVMIPGVANVLRKAANYHGKQLEVIESAIHTEPFHFL